jgi:hypothetical protein
VTVTDLPPPAAVPAATPASQNRERLRAMLDDPDLAGFHDDIRAAIVRLAAVSVLGAR